MYENFCSRHLKLKLGSVCVVLWIIMIIFCRLLNHLVPTEIFSFLYLDYVCTNGIQTSSRPGQDGGLYLVSNALNLNVETS